MYTDAVTFYNKYTDQNDQIYWYPHILEDVDLTVDKAANIAKTGLDNADTAKLHVKYSGNDDQIMVGGIQWLSPKIWTARPNDELGEYITFASGDFFVEGKHDDGVIKDSDYSTRIEGGLYDYMNRRYDNVFMVTQIGGPYDLIPHFEIGGK